MKILAQISPNRMLCAGLVLLILALVCILWTVAISCCESHMPALPRYLTVLIASGGTMVLAGLLWLLVREIWND